MPGNYDGQDTKNMLYDKTHLGQVSRLQYRVDVSLRRVSAAHYIRERVLEQATSKNRGAVLRKYRTPTEKTKGYHQTMV